MLQRNVTGLRVMSILGVRRKSLLLLTIKVSSAGRGWQGKKGEGWIGVAQVRCTPPDHLTRIMQRQPVLHLGRLSYNFKCMDQIQSKLSQDFSMQT